ncbi:hypothetical protein M419DRAFT_6310 [Trichoderma reesei RUT C-30]|uniref:non-specific serine/threonine protein kinase n=1 Tax=Hypocrea jecorina (strain ATCC 56765 / BCRC 32924 / NRRL 11460 / Rut C-30) TaxID=1344414 RepID=A0A024SFT9_HYPJR|nr:hypothetical protein M419DRAFT_6310 [Trichoderma reesei RUT C-30]
MDEATIKIIGENPIGNGLNAFRNEFASVCDSTGLASLPDAFDRLEQSRHRSIAFDLHMTLARLRAAQLLPNGDRSLLEELFRYVLIVNSDDFDLSRIKPLLKAILVNSDDVAVWTQVYNVFSEATPLPPLTPPSISSVPRRATTPMAATTAVTPTRVTVAASDTVATSAATSTPSVPGIPWTRNTTSILNSSEHCREIDPILKRELGNPRVGIRRFRESFFARVPNLETAAAAVFDKCCRGEEPLFGPDGWAAWPADAKEAEVLAWFGNMITKLEELAADYRPANMANRRKLLAQPKTPLIGSTGRRSMDIGFVNDDFVFRPAMGRAGRYRWSHILVPGELKSNPAADAPPLAWIDLATYAREVLSAQDNRRFVLALTLCGSNLRLWEYDRLGGMASEQFNINESRGGLEFVATMLGFLWMDEEGLGFDPSIMESQGKRFIEIERDGKPERLIIDEVITRPRCIASRATTCWKAHREDDPLKAPLVIKDSWQYPERDEEGLLVKEATEKGVINMARYYHHETVRIGGVEDERHVGDNSHGKEEVYQFLSILNCYSRSGGWQFRPTARTLRGLSEQEGDKSHATPGEQQQEHSSVAGTKRRQSEANLDNNDDDDDDDHGHNGAADARGRVKRSRSESAGSGGATPLTNRVHRRVVLQDYGKPIYTASSPTALLAALESCIRGHESLRRQAGLLHRDISINNVVIDEDGPGDRKGFLIDLDLAIKEQRIKASGTKGKTGTRAFMAIGVLMGRQHSFMHDLESFFWVLFWICVHYDGPDKARKSDFDEWNFMRDRNLAGAKLAIIYDFESFRDEAESSFTPFYAPLIPLMDRLRAVVFPNGQPQRQPDEGLYSAMSNVLLQGLE